MKTLGLVILIILAIPTTIDIVDAAVKADSWESGWELFKSRYRR
jgi:hypothetical protein